MINPTTMLRAKLLVLAETKATTADLAAMLIQRLGSNPTKTFSPDFVDIAYILFIICKVSPQSFDDFTMTKAVELLDRITNGEENGQSQRRN